MSHPILEIENWKKLEFDGSLNLSYNNSAIYQGLDIDAVKFYFFLKKKFGPTKVSFDSVKSFFPERMLSSGMEWCYLIASDSDYILISGDDKIHMRFLCKNKTPEKLVIDLFSHQINQQLSGFDLRPYNKLRYSTFINYSYHLKKLIDRYKNNLEIEIPELKETPSLDISKYDPANPKDKYNFIEHAQDYNYWLEKVLVKSEASLKIQILLPIYFESLIDLAFRIKLQSDLYSMEKKYGKYNIWQSFEKLSIVRKLKEIKKRCFQVNIEKIDRFIKSFEKSLHNPMSTTKDRNKLLHGNALYFKDLDIPYFLDDHALVGLPDRARAFRRIAESIETSSNNQRLLKTVDDYEKMCREFVDIFDDDGYLRSLVNSIAFLHNKEKGGCVTLGLSSYDQLFAPEEWD